MLSLCGIGHRTAICKFKTTKCHSCQKIGNLARVCRAKNKSKQVTKTDSKQANVVMKKSKVKVHQIETVPSKPILEYAAAVWYLHLQYQMHQIEKVQRSFYLLITFPITVV